MERVLILVKYGPRVASSRIRWIDVADMIGEAVGAEVYVLPLFPGRMRGNSSGVRSGLLATWQAGMALVRRVRAIGSAGRGDVIVVQKYAVRLERAFLRRAQRRGAAVLLDLDDAEWTISESRSRALDDLAESVDVAIGGNPEIGRWMREAGARCVVEIPTWVPLRERELALSERGENLVIWIGSPASAPDLRVLPEALEQVREHCPSLTFRVIGSGPLSFAPPWWEVVEWSPAVEERALDEAVVGLMPLSDTPLNRGKCAYKALRYAGAGVGVVASPVGVNADLLRGGLGTSASSTRDWVDQILATVQASDSAHGRESRRRAHELVEADYRREHYVHRVADALRSAARARS